MNEAIKLAVEKGGYRPKGYSSFDNYSPAQKTQAIVKMKFKERIVLDPLFWQALGKALEWDLGDEIDEAVFGEPKEKPYWLQYALDYHELLLTNSSTEKFWKELLTK